MTQLFCIPGWKNIYSISKKESVARITELGMDQIQNIIIDLFLAVTDLMWRE